MGDITYDVEWFTVQIDSWDQFATDMDTSRERINDVPKIPKLSERFPENLQNAATALNDVREQMLDNHEQAVKALKAMRDRMENAATRYVKTNAENQAQVDFLLSVIDQ